MAGYPWSSGWSYSILVLAVTVDLEEENCNSGERSRNIRGTVLKLMIFMYKILRQYNSKQYDRYINKTVFILTTLSYCRQSNEK